MSSYIDQLKQSMEEEKKMYEMAQAQQTATLNQQKDPITLDSRESYFYARSPLGRSFC